MNKFERFEAWLRDNGASFEMLELREYGQVPASTNDSSHRHDHNFTSEEKKDSAATTITTTLSSSSSTSTKMKTAKRISNSMKSMMMEEEQEESEMRGVHAKTYIPPDTVCMVIPRKCLITVEMGQATPLGQIILHSDLDLDAPKHIFLMIYVLWDRKVNGIHSFFHPYYDILPQTLKNMPIFWSDEELQMLTGSHLLEQIADRKAAIAEDYYAIYSVAPEALSELCTLQEFQWARMCVCSRNFGLQMDGHRTSALVPHADMLNHYRPRETKWTFEEDRQAFTITTLQGIPSGAQVYDSYGQKCNHRFLLNYGFAVEDNRELDGFCPNEVPIELGVRLNDPLYHQKVEFWTRGDSDPLLASLQHSSLSAALEAAAAAKQQQQQVLSSTTHGTTTTNTSSTTKTTTAPASPAPVKRVRVCASNNENTRLLFSLLRTLACNEAELMAISASSSMGDTTGGGGQGARHNSTAMFGLSDQRINMNTAMSSSSSSMASSTAHHHHHHYHHHSSPTSFYRSCRDVRHPISLRNERAAMILLLDTLHSMLARYPTTLSQDVNDLMNNDLAYPPFSNARHAKIQVRGEKEVLHHFCTWAKTALDVMNVIEQEIMDITSANNYTTTTTSDNSVFRNTLHSAATIGATTTGNNNNDVYTKRQTYDGIISEMESSHGAVHHTIVRYCDDVLGSLRREEWKNIRRRAAANATSSTTTTALLFQQQYQQPSTVPSSSAGGRRGGGAVEQKEF